MNGRLRLPTVPNYSFPGCEGSQSLVVGGAGGGVGTAVVKLLLQSGSQVVVVDRDEGRLNELARAYGADGDLRPVVADVATEHGLETLRETVRTSRLVTRHLVNVIGGVTPAEIGGFLDLSRQGWSKALETNTDYALWTCQIVARELIAAGLGGGSMVNLTVADATRAMPWFSGYAAARSALESMTRTMAIELAGNGIRCNSVGWGLIDSPRMHPGDGESSELEKLIPMGRRGAVSEIATCVAFLLSDLASYVTGQNLAADGGLSGIGPHYAGQGHRPVFLESEEALRAVRKASDA